MIVAIVLRVGYLITKIKEKLLNFFYSIFLAIAWVISWILYTIFYFMFKRFAKKVRDEIENTSGKAD